MDEQLAVGSIVRLAGLKEKPELNGQLGAVVGHLLLPDLRLPVRVVGRSSHATKVIQVKPENLEVVEDALPEELVERLMDKENCVSLVWSSRSPNDDDDDDRGSEGGEVWLGDILAASSTQWLDEVSTPAFLVLLVPDTCLTLPPRRCRCCLCALCPASIMTATHASRGTLRSPTLTAWHFRGADLRCGGHHPSHPVS